MCACIKRPCRHDKESKVPSLSSKEALPETKALIEDLQDVLRLDQLWGIAQKHLKAAYDRGHNDAASGYAVNQPQEQADGNP